MLATAKVAAGAGRAGNCRGETESTNHWLGARCADFRDGADLQLALSSASPLVVQPIGYCAERLELVTPVGRARADGRPRHPTSK